MGIGITMDEFDVLICQGRFSNADIDEETKFPKLLPSQLHLKTMFFLFFIAVKTSL